MGLHSKMRVQAVTQSQSRGKNLRMQDKSGRQTMNGIKGDSKMNNKRTQAKEPMELKK